MHEHPKPDLNGTSIEICLALIYGDHTPEEAASHSLRIQADSLTSPLLCNAWMSFERAAALNELENLDRSLVFMDSARESLRQVALLWLTGALCPCCIVLREQLERGENGDDWITCR